MREKISSSAQFDDARYWQFARSSGLPVGYFGPTRAQRSSRRLLLAAAVLAAALLGLAITAGEVSDEEIRVTAPRSSHASR